MQFSKIKIVRYSVLIPVILILFSCNNHKNTKDLKKAAEFDQTKNWIVLEKSKANKDSSTYSWNFNLKQPVKYVIQLVSENQQFPVEPTLVKVKIGELEFEEPLVQSYTINASQIVSEFHQTIEFTKTGEHTISIETAADFEQIRIIPHFKNPIGSGEYDGQWLKMHQAPEKQAALAWFKDAKFGMFIHWGLYSQVGGIWKDVQIKNAPFTGPKVAEWLMFKFQISRDEYRKLVKTFNPDKSFAQNIAKLAKNAGMKYIVITSKHHDGFALFDSKSSTYDMVDATPYKADVVKELYEACLAEGLDFGVYYSHGNDWMDGTDGNYKNVKKVNDSLGIYTHPSGKNFWDPSSNTHAEYLESKAYPQIEELIHLLPKLRLIWFDGEGFITEAQSFKFYEKVFSLNPSILVNRRVGWGFGDYEDAGDNKIPSADEVITKYWETCGTTNNSWGYNSYDDDWKSTQELLYYFVDIMSKGGNYLLNIGPDGLGHVPEKSAKGLHEMGAWIEKNKEAIYGTSRWKITNEGEDETLLNGTEHREVKGFKRTFTPKDFWFTAKGNKVYAIVLIAAEDSILIHSFNKEAGNIKNVTILGSEKQIEWKQTELGLEVDLKGVETNENGFVVAVEFIK